MILVFNIVTVKKRFWPYYPVAKNWSESFLSLKEKYSVKNSAVYLRTFC